MSDYRRLNPVSTGTAILVLLACLGLATGLVSVTRKISDSSDSRRLPKDLIPSGWKITEHDPWYLAHPNNWTVAADGNAVNFNKELSSAPIIRVENQAGLRNERLAALEATSYTKKDSYYLAGYPAIRYTYPDKLVHLIAYQSAIYEVTVFGKSTEIDIALATFAFLR